jgi:hypothetical protein
MIRGEYWLVDGDPRFADGDVGESDHAILALQEIRYTVLSEFGWDGDVEALRDNDAFLEELEELLGTNEKDEVARRLAEECSNPELAQRLLPAAFEQEDAREAAIRHLGWKWVKRDWVGTFNLAPADMQQIARGIDQILDEEGIEPGPEDEIEVRILSTGKSLFLSMEDINGSIVTGKHPVAGATYQPEPGYGATVQMDRKQLHACYAEIGD